MLHVIEYTLKIFSFMSLSSVLIATAGVISPDLFLIRTLKRFTLLSCLASFPLGSGAVLTKVS